MFEKWLDIPGYESIYQVSNKGSVRGLDRVNTYPDGHEQRVRGRKLKPGNARGYRYIQLKNASGVKKGWNVHQLVLLAFVGPCPEGTEVAHLDSDKQNNHLDNLSYMTHKQNLRMDQVGSMNHAAKMTDQQVEDIRTRYAMGGETYESLALEFDRVPQVIGRIIRGELY